MAFAREELASGLSLEGEAESSAAAVETCRRRAGMAWDGVWGDDDEHSGSSPDAALKRRRRAWSGAYVTPAMAGMAEPEDHMHVVEHPESLRRRNDSQEDGPSGKDVPALADLLGLLAYEDPQQSPLNHLLSPRTDHAVADLVNDAVLSCTGDLGPCPLALVLRQIKAISSLSQQMAGGYGPAYALPPL